MAESILLTSQNPNGRMRPSGIRIGGLVFIRKRGTVRLTVNAWKNGIKQAVQAFAARQKNDWVSHPSFVYLPQGQSGRYSGKHIVKVEPRPNSVSTSICPSCRSMIKYAIESPRPKPFSWYCIEFCPGLLYLVETFKYFFHLIRVNPPSIILHRRGVPHFPP